MTKRTFSTKEKAESFASRTIKPMRIFAEDGKFVVVSMRDGETLKAQGLQEIN